jgi:hypothetical protein
MPRKALVTFDFPSAPTVGGATTWYVTPTGTNASGTWGISVTGNAGTATTLQTARNINGTSFNGSANIIIAEPTFSGQLSGYTQTDANTFTGGLTARYLSSGATNKPTGTDHALLTMAYDSAWAVQLAGDWRTNTWYSRTEQSGTWGSWVTMLSSANYNSFAPTLTGTGASGNWGINVTGSSASTTGNAGTATTLQTARTINGVSFNGSANITITANTPNTLTIGTYLTGNNFNGSAATTWAVDATTTATASKIVARNGSGDDFRRYGFAEYFNMSHGASGATTDTVFYSSGDDYIRKNNATGFRASLNVPTRTGGDASGTWGISITGNAATVTNGVYTTGNQTIAGDKTFSGTTALAAASTVDGGAIGYRHVPVTVSNAATNIAQTHNGKAIGKDDTTAYTYSIPDGLDIGTIITVFNNAASGNITVAMTGSEVMRLAGTTSTGSRTVGPYGEGTFHKVSATTWLSAGPAVS